MTLEKAIKKVKPLDRNAMDIAQKRWDSIAKPLHSLGKLETLLIQIAGITGNAEIDLSKRGLIAMCADNGVVEEGVTQTGQEVTAIVAENFLNYDTSVGVMCKQNHAEIFPVDMGMITDTKVRTDHKVAYGTKNMTKGPAMTREQAVKGIAGMAGVFLGGAIYGIPVVMDGFISCVSALIAMQICPAAGDYMIASHVSREPAAHLILEHMNKEAVLHADMCLGEGTGAVALFPILDLAAAVYHSMSTFDVIHVEQYEELK